MRIDDIEQEILDIDWFAVDSYGHIIHLSSAGGILPESVATSKEALWDLKQYFLTIQENNAPITPAPEIDPKLRWNSYYHYARRGLFTFDRIFIEDRLSTQYRLVAQAIYPLTIGNIPSHLSKLLSRTKLPYSIIHVTTLDTAIIS